MRDYREELGLVRRLQTKPPVDIAGIARVMGLKVWEDHDLPEGIAGKILKDSKNGGSRGHSIVVRAQDPYSRKRFTVAHELAHYILHRNQFIGDSLSDDALYRSGLSSRVEAQANGLAAELLMPWHLLLPFVGKKSNQEIADLFGVSGEAMRIRLESKSYTSPQLQTLGVSR
jgi:hypothetical protein